MTQNKPSPDAQTEIDTALSRRILLSAGVMPFDAAAFLSRSDPALQGIAKRAIAADSAYFSCMSRYSRIFGLCRLLDITNIYDIGCGSRLQSFLLLPIHYIRYTGVDPKLFRDPSDGFEAEPKQVNALFREWTGSDRIRYIKDSYPCHLDIRENNIAILYYLIAEKEEQIRKLGENLSRDFDRVLLTVSFREEAGEDAVHRRTDIWKTAMPDFTFLRIGEPNLLFGTRKPVDLRLLSEKFTITDDGRLLSGFTDGEWHI